MDFMLPLLDRILRHADAGESLAVCTVVRTRGSTPQKAGAVMVVLRDGQTVGTIGGGCVEAEVRSRAMRSLTTAGVSLHAFKLDEDHGWDDGLVCGGTMEVALQVIQSADDAQAFRAARDLLIAGEPADLTVAVGEDRFDRRIEPTPTLVIAGAGHVGTALAVIGRQMDFDVTVIDDRADYAKPERFPAGVVCRVGDVSQELSKQLLGPSAYVVIVTRGHLNDGRALGAVIESRAKYIGLIGSKRKVLTIFKQLLEQQVPREKLSRVHAPIGLDIGAVTPGEIAVSIAAQLIAVRRGEPAPHATMGVTAEQIDSLRTDQA